MQKQALLVAVVIAVVVVVVVLLVIYKPLWGRRALLQLSRGRADFLRGIVAAVRTVAPGPPSPATPSNVPSRSLRGPGNSGPRKPTLETK